jgi:hypothetical protein
MIASEATLPPLVPPPEPEPEPVTVRVPLELTLPVHPDALAVIVVVPAPTAVAIPAALTVATEGTLEVQVTELVMFCVDRFLELPYDPTAVNCTV